MLLCKGQVAPHACFCVDRRRAEALAVMPVDVETEDDETAVWTTKEVVVVGTLTALLGFIAGVFVHNEVDE